MGIPFSSPSCVIIITLIMSSLVASLVLLSVIGLHVNALPYGTDKECWEDDDAEHCCWREGLVHICTLSVRAPAPATPATATVVPFEVAQRHLTEEEYVAYWDNNKCPENQKRFGAEDICCHSPVGTPGRCCTDGYTLCSI